MSTLKVYLFERRRKSVGIPEAKRKIKENGKRVYWKKEHYRGKKGKEKKKRESLHSRGRKEHVLPIKIIEALIFHSVGEFISAYFHILGQC